MSLAPMECDHCSRECVFAGLAPFNSPPRAIYAVAWRCPNCDRQLADVCPVGPAIPDEGSCLNCGERYEADGNKCTSCGIGRAEVRAYLMVDPVPAQPVAAASELLSRGLARRAVATLNAALLADPKNVMAWLAKAAFLRSFGDHHDAIPVMQRAVELGAPASVSNGLGFSLQEAGRHEEAVAIFRAVLAKPEAAEILSLAAANLANSLRALKQGTLQEIEDLYARAIRLTPGVAAHYLNLSIYRSSQQRFRDALSAVDSGIRDASADPASAQLFVERCWLLCEEGAGKDALAAADEALRRSPGDVRVFYLRGRALAQVGRLIEARVEMTRVLGIDPANADATRAIAMIDDELQKQQKH